MIITDKQTIVKSRSWNNDATFTSSIIGSARIIISMNIVVIAVAMTGVFRFADTFPSTPGIKPSRLIARGLRDAAIIPAFAVVINASIPAAAVNTIPTWIIPGVAKIYSTASESGVRDPDNIFEGSTPTTTKRTRIYNIWTTINARKVLFTIFFLNADR